MDGTHWRTLPTGSEVRKSLHIFFINSLVLGRLRGGRPLASTFSRGARSAAAAMASSIDTVDFRRKNCLQNYLKSEDALTSNSRFD